MGIIRCKFEANLVVKGFGNVIQHLKYGVAEVQSEVELRETRNTALYHWQGRLPLVHAVAD